MEGGRQGGRKRLKLGGECREGGIKIGKVEQRDAQWEVNR